MSRRTLRYRLRGVLCRPSVARDTIKLLGELHDLGWQDSVVARLPIDRDGEPLPWMNYGAITVLDSLVRPDVTIFEYGCGFSTVWLSHRSAHVHSVEHDRDWAERVSAMTDERVSLRIVPCGGDTFDAPPGDPYVDAPLSADGGAFDMVIVDGMARRSCLPVAARCLAPGGVLVLDDSERPAYAGARAALAGSGRFRELVVRGPKPSMGGLSNTSFFLPVA